jgi:urease accessory protein
VVADTSSRPALLALMSWLSPAFPVGAFAYSHGLEWAFEAGDIFDSTTLEAWLNDLIAYGAPFNDAIFCACTWKALEDQDANYLIEITELALALANSTERRLETVTQGNAFMQVISVSWPNASTAFLRDTCPGDIPYPVAIAAAAMGYGIALDDTLAALLHSIVANFISAAVRLGVIGQTDGQKLISHLIPQLHQLAVDSVSRTLDDLGGAAFRSDLAALHHETQYSRLFRS